MANAFDLFTVQARGVLERAADEAALHHHRFIGTEHLLLGLLILDEGPAAETLAELGIGVEGARDRLVRIVGACDPSVGARPGLTLRAKEAIMVAVDEANRRQHGYVGTEHLLLGLMRDEHAVSVALCQQLGVGPQDVRRAVERRISRN